MRTIKVLPIEQMYFIKKISLDDTISSLVVCYARNLSEEYRMNPDRSAREKHLYLGYSEKEFPCDVLDKKILKEIQRNFPKAKPQSSLLMLNVDKENYQIWLSQYEKKELNIVIEYVSSNGLADRVHNIQPKIEVYYPRVRSDHNRRMNTNIHIIADDSNEYCQLCSLLDKSYKLMSDVINN